MLRFLGKTENVIKFQQFCGLSWDSDSFLPKCSCPADAAGKTELNSNVVSEEVPLKDAKKNCQTNSNCFRYTSGNKLPVGEFSKNNIVHKFFELGSELGNELFYITFLPFVFWNVDDYIARRLIVLWVFTMYTGQGLKDIMCWPRPPSPPVLRWDEVNYVNEFGMPSTHAIAGSIIPFGLVYFSYKRFDYNIIYGIAFFLTWTLLVCLSRVYKGMHTFQDLLAGLSIAGFITALWLPYLDLSLEMFLSTSNAWIFILVIPLLMIYVFPTRCMDTRNDTVTIIAVGCGCMLASWTNFYIDGIPLPDPYKDSPRPIISTNLIAWCLFSTSRFVIGVAILIPIKIFMKTFIKYFGAFLSKADASVTIPYYFLTYSSIGYAAVYVAPRMFDFVGLIL